jgi:RNA polymerase sigma factor (sigma-70 family)
MATPRPLTEPEALLAHQPFLRAIARSLLRGADGVDGEDDVVQEALVRASQAEPPSASRLSSWLARIVRNVGLDHRRAARRARRLYEQLPPREAAPSAEEVLQQEEERRRVVHAVVALPQPYRDTVLLRYWDDLTPAQIAAQLAVPGATVRSQLQRGLAMVRERLDAEYGDRRAWLAALAPVAGIGDGALQSLAWGTFLMTKLKVVASLAALLLVGLTAWMWFGQEAPPIGGAPSDTAPPVAAAQIGVTVEPTVAVATPDTGSADARQPAMATGELAVRGQVLHRRKAHGGLTLTMQWFAGSAATCAPEAEFQVPCDPEGRFEWRGPRRASVGFVTVIAPRQQLQLWCNGELVMPEQRDVALDVSVLVFDHVLTGRVHDRAGAAIAGARLNVNGFAATEATADAQGRYEMHVPAPGYPLMVRASGYRHRLVQGYFPADTMRHEFDVELQPGSQFAGCVVDGNAQPVAAAQVRTSGTYDTVVSDADGRFVVDGVGAGEECTVSVRKPGFQSADVSGVGGGEPIEVVLQPGHKVELRAVDASLAPVVGAIVHLVSRPMGGGWTRLGITGLDGRFTLADLPSRDVELIVEKAGFVRANCPLDPREQKEELVVTLASGNAIRGQVLDADGVPLSGASVYCQLGAVPSTLRPTAPGKAVGSNTNSDTEGRFEMKGLPAEKCTLFVHHPEHIRAAFVFVGGAVTDTTVHMRRAPSIAGLVLDGVTGKPIESFSVVVTGQLPLEPLPFRGPEGRFRLRHWRLPADVPLTIEVHAAGYAPARTTTQAVLAPAPDQNVVRLFAGTRVEGIVRDPVTDAPLAGVTVALVRADAPVRPNDGPATDASGRFVLEAVAPGEQRLRLQHAERPEAVFGPFTVGPGPGVLEVRPTMGSGVALRGRITGAPDAAGLTVLAYRAGGDSAQTAVREDLTFELRPLGVGRTTVLIKDRNGRERFRHVDVGAADVEGFEFAWRRGSGSLQLEIGGATAGEVDVRRIEGAATGMPDRVSFATTPVVVDGLAPGRYRVTVRSKQGGASGTAEVDVASGEVAVRVECCARD